MTAFVAIAVVTSIIPVNTDFRQQQDGIPIYVRTNGVHTDIVMPARIGSKDWIGELDLRDTTARWLAFGWGHKQFYIETPEWKDLKLSTAFNAIFFIGETALHVSHSINAPTTGDDCKRVSISKDQYLRLCAVIDSTFKRNSLGTVQIIPVAGYGANDLFYEAHGTYGFANTCNNWVNDALRKAGIRTSLWSPFEHGVLYHLKDLE